MAAPAAPIGNIIIATTTFYKEESELRFQLTLEMIRKAKQCGYKVIIVDASQNLPISEKMKEAGAYVFFQNTTTMGASRREAFFHAAEELKSKEGLAVKIIVWIEPEKIDMIRHIEQVVAPILRKDADVVIPQRTAASWKSYPQFQQDSEQMGNAVFAQHSGRELDVFFGPVACNLKAAKKVITFDPMEYNGVADTYVPQYLAALAIQEGDLCVDSVFVDFQYPPAQKEQEEKVLTAEFQARRKQQLATVSAAHERILQRNPIAQRV